MDVNERLGMSNTLDYTLGLNKDIKNDVLSLITETRRAIVYTSAHTAVIYDLDTQTQQLLQGHCNQISCICVSRDRKWIFTADTGPDSMIIVWNSETGIPVKNIFSQTEDGVIAMDLSPDSTIIATLSTPVYPNAPQNPGQHQDGAQSQPQASTQRDVSDGIEIRGVGNEMMDIILPTDNTAESANTPVQEIILWDWLANESHNIIARSIIRTGSVQHHIKFNETNPTEIATTGPRRVVFWTRTESTGEKEEEDDENSEQSEGTQLAFYSPALNTKDLHREVAPFIQTCFFPHSTQTVTSTSDGDFVLWDTHATKEDDDDGDDMGMTSGIATTGERRVVKILKLHPRAASVLLIHDRFLITGDVDGNIRFFDFQFRLTGWFEDIGAGAISSIALCDMPPIDKIDDALGLGKSQKDMDPRTVALPDLIIGTTQAKVVQINGSSFAEETMSGAHGADKKAAKKDDGSRQVGRGELLLKGQAGPVFGIAMHPKCSLAAIANRAGTVTFYDTELKKVVAEKQYDKAAHTIAFDPTGHYIAIGFRNGMLKMLLCDYTQQAGAAGTASNCFVEHWTFHNSSDTITRLVFAPDGNFMAGCDLDRCVLLYRRRLEGEEVSADEAILSEDGDWVYVGRNRCHRKKITGLEFALSSTHKYVLFSISADRRLVEFDVEGSSVLKGFKVADSWKIEQVAIPTACLYLPASRPPPEHVLRASAPSASGGPGSDGIGVRDSVSSLIAGGMRQSQSRQMRSSVSTTPKEVAKQSNPAQAGKQNQTAEEIDPALFKASGTAKTFGYFGPGDCILIATSDMKFKFLDAQTKRIRRVVLAPAFGLPVNRFVPFPANATGGEPSGLNPPLCKRYIAYTTEERIVGIIKLPLDGNLLNTMGLIAHPHTVADAVLTHDGTRLLTVGGEDYTIFGWKFDPEAMERWCSVQNVDVGSNVHIAQLEGGMEGPLYNEIVNMFYYAQLRSQGEDTTIGRKITGEVPMSQVPNIVRAIGFFPTEKEVADLIADFEWSGREKTGQLPKAANLNEFLRVYVNHRPVQGPTQEDIEEAFKKLGAEPLTGVLSRETLLNILMESGEKISAEILSECLSVLTKLPPTELKENMTAADFSMDVLGFGDVGEYGDEGDMMEDEYLPE
ncbi:putative Cilia- and flagella-associated protein 251 [Blattamonas nauphoetae]|uniref:Cilia- and flagella-associated protein 251 n=1 Tax=Blattamonas nauphoetae TaxID=2049346 RepID=A0ABQ9YKY1_9EUKA|nr:putative Cilia- and flagella-associated protein 251 [Blattamonas nauphoetae]